jgi:hypothetical protein
MCLLTDIFVTGGTYNNQLVQQHLIIVLVEHLM